MSMMTMSDAFLESATSAMSRASSCVSIWVASVIGSPSVVCV